MNTSLQDFDYMRADRRVVAAAADIGAKTIVEGTGQGRRTASYQIWLDGSSLFSELPQAADIARTAFHDLGAPSYCRSLRSGSKQFQGEL